MLDLRFCPCSLAAKSAILLCGGARHEVLGISLPKAFTAAAAAVLGLFGIQAAPAQVEIGWTQQGSQVWFFCEALRYSGGEKVNHITSVFSAPRSEYQRYIENWRALAADRFGLVSGPGVTVRCSDYSSSAKANDSHNHRYQAFKDEGIRPSNINPVSDRAMVVASEGKKRAPTSTEEGEADTAESSATSLGDAEDDRVSAREAREAEWQAKVATHEAAVADYERKVKAREAEIARQQAEHAAAQEAAAKEQAAYEAKMAAHRRELEEANRRQQEYFAAQRRHALCVNGEHQWCDDIDGKPALEEKLASKEEPKTSDDDARTCVSRPVVSASDTFKGQTAAVVFNGCKTAVDVRVCLLRTGGWNCGVKWGLQPQDRWTHTSFETQGEIFWDARIAGSNEPLANPESD